MGGGSSSQSRVDIANRSVVNAMTQAIMRCKGNSRVSQSVVIMGDGNVTTVKQVQMLKLSSSCGQDITALSDIKQSVADAIKQASSAQSDSVLGALTSSSSKDETFIKNDVEQNITAETITEVVNSINATQELIVKGNRNITDVSQEQTMDIAYDACNKVLSRMASVQAISNDTDQKTSSTQTNAAEGIVKSVMDGVGGIFQSMTFVWVILIIAAAYIVINGGFLGTLLGGDPENPNAPNPMMMQMMQQRNMQAQQMMQRNMQVNTPRPLPPMTPSQPMPAQPMQSLPPMPPLGAPPIYSTPMQQLRAEVG